MSVLVFIGLAYALSWAVWLPLVFSGATVIPGDLPTHIPGLMGPALAALIAVRVMEGRTGLADLRRRIFNVRMSPAVWLAALSPLLMLALALAIVFLQGGRPDWSGFGRYSGLPQWGVLPVALTVFIVNGFGEEIGWRGFLLPRLQARFGPVRGTLLLWPVWALWHLPNFWFLANFTGMDIFTLVFGWGLGILCGTLVLANVTHLARGGVVAPALWHTLFNMGTATDTGPLIPAVVTTLVMIWAALLAWRLWRDRSGRVLDVA